MAFARLQGCAYREALEYAGVPLQWQQGTRCTFTVLEALLYQCGRRQYRSGPG